MDTGIACAFGAPNRPLGAAIAAAAEAAEIHGARTWWSLADREIATGSSHDPTLCLQRVARATTSLRIALGGDLVAARSAALRAKQLATLAWFAGGRLEVGLDIDLPPRQLAEGPSTDETDAMDVINDRVQAQQVLWSQQRAAYDGATLSFRGAIALPKPPGGRVAIHVRHTDRTRLARLGEAVDGLAGWTFNGGGEAELIAARDDVVGAFGVRARTLRATWFVDAARVGSHRPVAERVGVDELVAVFDRVPEPHEVAAVIEEAQR